MRLTAQMRGAILGALWLWVLCGSQEGGLARAQERPVFTAAVRLVEVEVYVPDRNGVFIRDLARDDFELREDGRPHDIQAFALVDLASSSASSTSVRRERSVESDLATNQQGPGRVYVMLLDTNGLENDEIKKAQLAARQFVDTALEAADLMAIVHPQGTISDAQPLTGNKRLLHASINRLRFGDSPSGDVQVRPILDTYRAIQDVAERLGGIEGRRKAILWIGGDVPYDPQVEFTNAAVASSIAFAHRDAIRAATRNNVAVYPIDPRGLRPNLDPPGRGTAPNPTTYVPPWLRLRQPEVQRQAALRAIAEETGGEAIVNTNNFKEGYGRIVRDNTTYYVLGYQPATEWRDGGFHTIDVRVKRPGLSVRARRGYYAPQPGSKSQVSPTLTEGLSAESVRALRSPIPVRGLGLDVLAVPFRGTGATGSVLLGAHLHATSLKADAEKVVEVSYLAIDEQGRVWPGGRRVFTLGEAARASSASSGYSVFERLNLPPGRHEVRVVAHQPAGPTGSVVAHVEVPDFGAGPLAMSGIVLASIARSFMTLRGDLQLKETLSAEPTLQRRFQSDDTVTAFVEVYTESRTKPGDVRITATVTTSAGARVRSESGTIVSSEPGRIGYTIRLPLATLRGADYVLAIEARQGRRAVARQVPFSVM